MKYSKADFQHDTPPRIVGQETEYTTAAATHRLFTFISGVPELDGAVSALGDDKNIWIPDGSRVYCDYGDITEVAGPESLSGREVELHNRAGEYIIDRLTELEAAASGHRSLSGSVLASKRSAYVDVFNSKHAPILTAMSMGHHENYFSPVLAGLMDAAEKEYNALSISSYLCTRGAWAGAGIVAQDGYHTTQKFQATYFNGDENKTSHGRKTPFIRHPMGYRLEVRLGDGNMLSQTAIDTVDLTSLVLRMVEHDKFPEELRIDNPNQALLDSSVPGRLVDTRSGAMTGAEHQRRIVEAALEFAGRHENTPKHEIAAAERVVGICDCIELFDGSMDSLELISEDVEWAAKLQHIRKRLGEGATINAKNLNAVREDLRWEDISPTRSPSRKWYAGHGDPFTQAEILHAAVTPPRTRALARTAVLHSASSLGSITWQSVSKNKLGSFFPDPYDCDIIPLH